MLVEKTEFLITPKRKAKGLLSLQKISPLKDSVSQKNISRKEPLNNNSADLSFKGSILYTQANKGNRYLKHELLDFLQKNLGHMGEDLYNHVASSELPIAKKMFQVNSETDEIIFHKKSIPHLIRDGLLLKNIPTDIVNGVVSLAGKIKPLKSWSEEKLNSSYMKKLRAESKIEAQISALRGLAEKRAKLLAEGKSPEEIRSAMLQQKTKMFDPKKGNYDTKHERPLNRIVSGIPPALFLANDSYNLSRMMDDDKDKAEHEKKIRFRQEMSRIFINAYITLVTFGALQKVMNNSNIGIMLATGLTALFTESVSRLTNGKHITRLTPEEARKENLKNNAPEKDIKSDTSFKAQKSHTKFDGKHQQKPLLSLDTLAKASAGVIATGFALKFARKSKAIDNAFNVMFRPFKNLYNKLTTTPDYKIDEATFNKIVKVLSETGFSAKLNEEHAAKALKDENYFKYLKAKAAEKIEDLLKRGNSVEDEIIKTDLAEDFLRVAEYAKNTDGSISLGARDKKIKPFVNFVIAPFKFAWSTVTLPYRLVDKAIKAFSKKSDFVKLHLNDKRTLQVIAQTMKKDLILNENFIKNNEYFISVLK